ncbi:MAG: hypothetical protein IJY09_10905 [Lachnospiraceae bacterium]|nr:hypothetical protein [Lachnospiraceae bacterium]
MSDKKKNKENLPKYFPGSDPIDEYEFSLDAPDMSIPTEARMQDSAYSPSNKAAPANNLFFAERSNPLSSKGS